ncbi:MAG TPA: agmatinase family protein [Acidimicrobiia bacterium]|nr:agmatinase family protein [Acidimicrobiia bacterium]
MAINDPHWPRADVWLAQDHPDPEILVVGVPSSRASLSPSRADLTPLELRHRLARFSTFHGEWGVDFGGVTVRDEGNWPVSELDMHQMPETVEQLARSLPRVPLTLYLGGDNAITRPLARSQSAEERRVGLITFDAHHDVRTLDLGPSNGTPVRGLIDEDGLPGANVAQIGIHSFANSFDYRTYCEEQGVTVLTVGDVEQRGIDSVVEDALTVVTVRCDVIHIDVDIDVLDRAFAPACPGARPGGLGLRELAEGVRRCARHPKVESIDFVEVDAEADRDGITLDALAHLVLSAVAGYAERSLPAFSMQGVTYT